MLAKAKSKSLLDLRAYLEAEKERLAREISNSGISTDNTHAGYGTHMADDATMVFEQGRNAGLLRDHERALAEVEDALKRMDSGNYGICQHCGEKIDRARLRVLPMASLCLHCQRRLEAR